MRFRIEQTYLTDDEGVVVPPSSDRVRFHVLDAPNVDDALTTFVQADHGEVVGDVARFPGFQLVATAKRRKVVYTLHVDPVTEQFVRE
ncbi:MAG TPA: hypothetical protein VNM92_08800 [Thermoanaerobaculia bacterium]|nr:hypothetical protein [Thermoanaerobaculia bacterium]